MRYSIESYAKALAEVVLHAKGKDDAAIAKNFFALLQKNNDETRVRKILEAAERFIHRGSGTRKVILESARSLRRSPKSLLKDIVRPGDAIEERIDPSLIAGVKIVVNDELQLDGSLRGKLDAMFRNI